MTRCEPVSQYNQIFDEEQEESLSWFLEDRQADAYQMIRDIDQKTILESSAEDTAKKVVAELQLEKIVLGDTQLSAPVEEHDGFRIEQTIHFSGSHQLLLYRPSRYLTQPPAGSLKQHSEDETFTIQVALYLSNHEMENQITKPAIEKIFADNQAKIEKNLEFGHGQIDFWNGNLHSHVLSLAQARKQRLENAKTLLK